MSGREIRRGVAGDVPALAGIFWRGVHEGAAPRYDEDQRRAWLPAPPDPEVLAARLAPQAVFVSEEDGTVTGFMTLTAGGLLDLAYVLPERRRSGTAPALLAMVENHAAARRLGRLTTRASDMARPFLARHGWRVLRPAPQVRDGVTIPATDMIRGPESSSPVPQEPLSGREWSRPAVQVSGDERSETDRRLGLDALEGGAGLDNRAPVPT